MKRIVPKWWTKSHRTTYGNIVTTAFVLILAAFLIFGQITHLKDSQVAQAKREVLLQTYNNAVVDHAREVVEYNSCLAGAVDRVDRSEGLRATLTAITDLSDLFPDSEGAKAYTTSRQAIIEASFPPLDLAELQASCVIPSPAPVPPPNIGT